MATPPHDLIRDMGVEAAKAAPPVIVSAVAWLSAGLPVAIGLLTIAYLMIQMTHLLWKWRCQVADRRAARDLRAAEAVLDEPIT